jgi:hypothetical protein
LRVEASVALAERESMQIFDGFAIVDYFSGVKFSIAIKLIEELRI